MPESHRVRSLVYAASGVLLLLLQASVGSQTAPTSNARRTSAWKAVECGTFKVTPPADSNVECGYVTVPLRHSNPDGPTIQLATVILPSTAADKKDDPLFMAQGGPGGSSIDTYANYLLEKPSARPASNRDFVIWDQRGTLYSKPALMCPEVSNQDLKDAIAGTDDAKSELAAYGACGERLQRDSVDLSAFNSAENAHDIEDLRVALGYDTINFYGVSYGTELGQFLMREHPEHLRTVVLDAVVPLTYNLFTEPAFAQQRIGEKYLNGCAADPRCNAAFPNLARRFLALVDRLNANPVSVQVTPVGQGNQSYQIKLTGSLLEGALYQSLYSDVHDFIPLIVDRADRGDYSYVSALLLPLMLFDDKMAEGMHETVACAERGDTNPDAVDFSRILPRLAKDTRDDAKLEVENCRQWKIELLPRELLEPVASTIPTLLLSGDFDPITPPHYAETLLATLPNAKHVIFPNGSHGQAITNDCSNGIIQRFLDDPNAALDTSCIQTVVPKFATEDDLITLPVLRQALAAHGIGGLIGVGVQAVPGLLGVMFLATSLAVYPLAGIISRFRRPRFAEPYRRSARIAPWLAVLTAVVLGVFFIGLATAVVSSINENQHMVGLGAVPARWRWLFTLPPVAAVLVVLMVLVTSALWGGRRRSFLGRVYFTVLTIAGLGAVANLIKLGVTGLWRG
ncbi:MAG TPA: alpha/beta hydrolase [Vicinamibacterales bacterium]|nr:alpha/beta hydrolase [Vicinamibacterales bacterium]